MKVLSVASEAYPLVKTGGLADVAGALPIALAAHGVAMRTLLPGYPAVMAQADGAEVAHAFKIAGGPARLLAARIASLDMLILDAPHLFARDGGLYGFADDAQRFAALARVASMIGLGLLADFVPDVVHCHDWQAGLAPAYLALDGRPRPASVLTVHNLAFQGQFPASLLAALDLPASAYSIDGVEYYNSIGFLKAGLYFADRITTVSPSYAREIQTPELGMGMDGLLRTRANVVSGILNGIDTSVWNPATDPALAANYDVHGLPVRARNKTALQRRMGLAHDPAAPLFGLITRLSWQKGIDLVIEALRLLRDLGAQVAVLGAGDEPYAAALRAATAAAPGQVAAFIGYDETLAHLIQAGADALLVPSRFEPCGLTQLCALRYGAVPVVARTGGLADSVVDASSAALADGTATGVQFAPATDDMLAAAIRRTVALHADERTWRGMQQTAMRADFSWDGPAAQYAALYREVAPRA